MRVSKEPEVRKQEMLDTAMRGYFAERRSLKQLP